MWIGVLVEAVVSNDDVQQDAGDRGLRGSL
jgi:hypothetical protein